MRIQSINSIDQSEQLKMNCQLASSSDFGDKSSYNVIEIKEMGRSCTLTTLVSPRRDFGFILQAIH